MEVFSCRPLSNILKYMDHRSEKQDSLKHMWNIRKSVFKFRFTVLQNYQLDTTRIKHLWETGLVVMPTNLGVQEISCSFRLVLEGKNRERDTWVIKIKVFRKDFSKQLCLIKFRKEHLTTINLEEEIYQIIFVKNTLLRSLESQFSRK